ncbi:MAG: DUF1109 family protein [Myxococcales bacterium]|nr:DUF1109 family protein [Myxococcales bacterium]
MNGPNAALRARVLSTVGRDPSPSRSALAKRTVAALLVGAVGASVFAATGRHETHEGSFSTSGGAILLAVALALSGLALVRRASSPSRVAPAIGLALAIAATLVLATSLWVDDPFAHLAVGVHLACSLMTIGLGVALVVAIALARRGTEPIAPGRVGLALGGVFGLWAAGLVSLRCGHAEVDHLLGAHLAPVVLVIGLAIVISRRLLTAGASTGASSKFDAP